VALEAAQGEVCQAANDNDPAQVVVSGHKAAVERALEIAKAKGAKRALLLPVSAPFHCDLMDPAADVMAEALDARGARVTGIDPAEKAIDAARAHARQEGRGIAYDVGVGEELPYAAASFDAVVCVDVLEHVQDLDRVLAEVARVLRPGGLFLFDTINRNPVARLATITVAEDVLRLLPKGTHDPDMFIKPKELRAALEAAGLTPGRFTGLGPRGVNRRFDLVFGPLPLTAVLYMGSARKASE